MVIKTSYITNKYNSIRLPYEEGLLEWLQQTYPHSQYQLKELHYGN